MGKLEKKKMILENFNDKHLNDTIFITGDGAQLSYLTKEQIKKIEKKITISVNYSHLVYNPTYWIGGHILHTLFSINFCDPATIKFFQKSTIEEHSEWIMDGGDENKSIPILCSYDINKISRIIKGDGPIFGCTNIGLAATSLAYMMGAKKIIYLGLDQKSLLHFYDANISYKEKMITGFEDIKHKYKYKEKLEYDHGMGEISMIIEKMKNNDKPASIGMQDYYNSNREIFTTCFNKFKQDGIDIISTVENSILVEAGAKFIKLDDVS